MGWFLARMTDQSNWASIKSTAMKTALIKYVTSVLGTCDSILVPLSDAPQTNLKY